jgi:hypothetical protein
LDEDEYYLKNPSMLNKVRRGQTEIRIGDKVEIGRKGLQKFFDLRQEFFEEVK